MKAHFKIVGFAIVFFLAFIPQRITAEYDVATYCQLVPIGTKFPSFESCQTYYTCQSSDQVVMSKCPGRDVFNKDTQSCVSVSLSNCFIDVENPCEGSHQTYKPDGKNCRIWHYCENDKILGSGICPAGQYFDGEMCRYGECPSRDEVRDLCQIMQDGEFFGDFHNCAVWNKCSNKKMITDTCPKDLIYDSTIRMCVYTNDNICAGPKEEECIASKKNTKKAHANICSAYFVCKQFNDKWLWSKESCSIGQYYDEATEQCKTRQEATPVIGCDRCEFSSLTWVNEVDTECAKYLICENGQQIGKGSCEKGYFNEQSQVCFINTKNLEEYRKQNGACAK